VLVCCVVLCCVVLCCVDSFSSVFVCCVVLCCVVLCCVVLCCVVLCCVVLCCVDFFSSVFVCCVVLCCVDFFSSVFVCCSTSHNKYIIDRTSAAGYCFSRVLLQQGICVLFCTTQWIQSHCSYEYLYPIFISIIVLILFLYLLLFLSYSYLYPIIISLGEKCAHKKRAGTGFTAMLCCLLSRYLGHNMKGRSLYKDAVCPITFRGGYAYRWLH